MKALHMITFILLAIGGLNWGLVAFGWNVVEMVFKMGSNLTMAVYILVGLSALFQIFTHAGYCKYCSKSASAAM